MIEKVLRDSREHKYIIIFQCYRVIKYTGMFAAVLSAPIESVKMSEAGLMNSLSSLCGVNVLEPAASISVLSDQTGADLFT